MAVQLEAKPLRIFHINTLKIVGSVNFITLNDHNSSEWEANIAAVGSV